MAKKGIVFNQDFTELYFFEDGENMTEEKLVKFIENYKDTDITDFCMNVNGVLSVFPSKVKTFVGDTDDDKIDGEDIIKKYTKGTNAVWKEKGLDAFQIWIDTCRKIGINPWVSIRMNDCHFHFDERKVFVDKDFLEHIVDRSRIRHRRQCQYYDRCRDFELLEVRQHMLDYIKETLGRYDPYGIELDFQRETDCFAPGHELNGQKIITELMKNIKEITLDAEKKYGHEIKISVHCNPNPIHCLEMGFDILEWAKSGYIDMFIPIGRWNSTDNNMPVKLWKQMLNPYGVEVAGGIQCLVNCRRDKLYEALMFNSYESALGSAASIMSQDSDKLYLYNYMHDTIQRFDKYDKGKGEEEYYKFLNIADDMDALNKVNRRHIVSYADKPPIWEEEPFVFPKTAKKDMPIFFKVLTGEIPDGYTAVVKMEIETDTDNFDVFVNSIKAEYIGKEDCTPPLLADDKLYCFKIDNSIYKSNAQIVEVFTDEDAEITVKYAEIYISKRGDRQ